MRYRGDTFIFPFILQDEQGNAQKFLVGDKVRFGVKTSIYTDQYVLYQEKDITENLEELQFQFEPEETCELEVRDYITELELIRSGQVDTIYQETLKVKGDVVNGTETNSNT